MLKTLNTSKPIPNHARTVTHKLKRTRVVSTSCKKEFCWICLEKTVSHRHAKDETGNYMECKR